MEETTPTPVTEPVAQVSTPTPQPTPTSVPPTKQSSMLASLGPVLALLIVLIAIIAGGLYVWGSLLSENDLAAPLEETPSGEQQNTQQNTESDEINAIESDVNSTDLETLDQEMNEMEAELDAGATIQ